MARSIDLDPVTTITADAVGAPGQRTFYIQATRDDLVVTLLVEKGQVQELARHLEALIARLTEQGLAPVTGAGPAPDLRSPLDPEFRVGPMALGFDADRDLVLLQCEEFVPDADDDDADDEDADDEDADDPLVSELRSLLGEATSDAATVRMWATRDQMATLARHAQEVVAAGRPRCKLCGNPIDPDGHFCPARNGHRDPTELA